MSASATFLVLAIAVAGQAEVPSPELVVDIDVNDEV